MQTIYLVRLHDDFGELWLDDQMRPVHWVSAARASFESQHHGFIFKHIGVELREIELEVSKKKAARIDKEQAYGEPDKLFQIFFKDIFEALRKK